MPLSRKTCVPAKSSLEAVDVNELFLTVVVYLEMAGSWLPKFSTVLKNIAPFVLNDTFSIVSVFVVLELSL